MPNRLGQHARFRRALQRPPLRQSQSRELRTGEEAFSPDLQALPREARQRIANARTESLLDLICAEDARVEVNRTLVAFAIRELSNRLGGPEALREAGAPRWAIELLGRAEQPDDTHLFVGWVDHGGDIEWEDTEFHPERSTDIDGAFLSRLRSLEGCGGVFGRIDDGSTQAQATRTRRTMSRWQGRSLKTLGPVPPERIARAAGPVASSSLRRFLDEATASADSALLALEGKQVVVLSATGEVYKLNRTETKHLALKGLVPRHWFLPLKWWKQHKVEAEEEQEDRKGRVRLYKGKYDDEQEVGFEDEKDDYGG